MAYVDGNPMTKKELKERIGRGERVTCFQPGLGEDLTRKTGTICVEGPHYPRPHRWYAEVTLRDGVVVKVK